MDTRHPEAAKPRATFMLPNWGVLRGLDEAHERGFRRFCDERNLDDRRRASTALERLQNALKGNEPPDYNDTIVTAAYLIDYHPQHCMMAYWAFSLLFNRVSVSHALYICDVGAGTGAARVGLALALLGCKKERKELPSTIYFDAHEPSDKMRAAGNSFVDALPGRVGEIVASFDYDEYAAVSDILPDVPERLRGNDEALRVVTAFHLSLPWYDNPSGNVGDAKSSLQSALRRVSPHAGLFTAHSDKEGSLTQALGDFARGANRVCIPGTRGDKPDHSQFYRYAKALGFRVTEGWRHYRFNPPRGVLLLQDKRAEQEERYRQRRAVPVLRPERRQQELAHYNRGLAYARKGEYDRAIQAYNQALTLKPNLDPAYYNRGVAYARKGEYRRAESDFSKALTLGYDRTKVEARLAELCQEHERREQAGAAERERRRLAAAERQAAECAEAAERERRERAERVEAKRQRKGVLARLWNALRGRN